MRGVRLSRRELFVALAAATILGLALSPLLWFGAAAEGESCAANLKQWGVALKMYANEDRRGRLPPLSPRLDDWIVDVNAVHPEYLPDLRLFICPESPHASSATYRAISGPRQGELFAGCVDSFFYNYTGYAVRSDAEMLGLFHAYETNPAGVITRTLTRIPMPEKGPGPQPAASSVPILWDRVFPHADDFSHNGGGNVLHMDGHAEFIAYSDANNSSYFPMTRVCADTIGSVLPLPPPFCRR